MAYANKVSAVVAVLFLAVAISPQLAESQTPTFPKMTPECAKVLPDLLEKCFGTVRETPTEECCKDLESATAIEVTCLCDNYIAKPEFVNITKPYADGITTKCGTLQKFSCDGTTKGGEDDGSSSDSSKSTKQGNGGKANKVAASMTVFGFLASLFFIMF